MEVLQIPLGVAFQGVSGAHRRDVDHRGVSAVHQEKGRCIQQALTALDDPPKVVDSENHSMEEVHEGGRENWSWWMMAGGYLELK